MHSLLRRTGGFQNPAEAGQGEPEAMRKNGVFFLWAFCVAALGACAYGAEAVPAKTPESVETARIKAGLDRVGVGKGYEIVVADDCAVVERTAAQMMQEFLAKGSLTIPVVAESEARGHRQILLGRESNLVSLRELGDQGKVEIRDVPPEDDGFHLKKVGKTIVVAGSNPRGVLYGVCAFQDFVNEGRTGALDVRKIPQTRLRFQFIPTVLMHDHPASYSEATEKTARYLARLGVNGCVDGGGGSWDLCRFVSSDVFPFQRPPDPASQNHIARASEVFKKYGIDYYIMLWEPTLARVRAEVGKYPPEALGKVKRPWGGDENGMDTTLCVNSPIVQQHYQNVVKKFVEQYPDVKGFLFYNLDGDSWLCTPGLCPRCKAVCTDSPPDTPHPWESQAVFTDLLARAAHDARSDFKFIHWISHFRGQAAENLVRQSREYDALAFGVQNGDHDLMITDPVKPSGSEFLMLQQRCAERSIPFLVTFSSGTHEVVPNGFQSPFHVARSLKKLNGWGVRAINSSGPIPYFEQANALTEKAFLWDPEQDPEAFIADLAVRQFGQAAGTLMYQAWTEIRDGMDAWKDLRLHPFCGSQTHVGLGFSYFTNAKAILPDIAKDYNYSLTILTNVEPNRAPDYQKYREKGFLDRFKLMGVHFAKAAALARQAIDTADPNEPIGMHYYEGESTPTMKQYAELNYGPLAIAATYCQLRSDMIGAYILLEGMKADNVAGNTAAAKEKEAQYHDLMREDIAVRKRFIGVLKELAEMHPCLTRTSLSEQDIANQIAYMNTEIEKTESFLSQTKE